MSNRNQTTVPAPDLEPDSCNAPLGTKEITRLDTRCDIRVISYRKLKHDPDGVSAKAVLDGLVRAGLLADDSTEQVATVTFESRKSKDERTEIIITPVDGR